MTKSTHACYPLEALMARHSLRLEGMSDRSRHRPWRVLPLWETLLVGAGLAAAAAGGLVAAGDALRVLAHHPRLLLSAGPAHGSHAGHVVSLAGMGVALAGVIAGSRRARRPARAQAGSR